MILQTPIKHFSEDIQRARNLRVHAENLPVGELRKDVFRSSWMMAVGAFDAYFCYAYGDLLARTFRAKQIQPEIDLPGKMKNITVPIPVILSQDLTGGWAWRMIARDLIEKDNVLSIQKIKRLFNVFCRDSHKLFTADGQPLERWIDKQQNMHRLFGFQRTRYRQAANGAPKAQLRKEAIDKIDRRLGMIMQRRHDCIHNCDRPKYAIKNLHMTPPYVRGVIVDLEYIVNRCQEELISEFPIFLTSRGFNPVTRNRVGV